MKCPFCEYEYPNNHMPSTEDKGPFWEHHTEFFRKITISEPSNIVTQSADMHGCPSCKGVFIDA